MQAWVCLRQLSTVDFTKSYRGYTARCQPLVSCKLKTGRPG
uniref:Uncharacterized protein n=1 Tax=Anguilla anguilla TaxID=7936 RepID=A0A0E9SRJ3_ANGAN